MTTLPTYKLTDLSAYKAAVDVLKLCPVINHRTSIKLHRIGKRISTVLDAHDEDVKAIREKIIERKKTETGIKEESKLPMGTEEVTELNREINNLLKEPVTLDLPRLSTKDFPEDPKALGSRKVSKQDSTGKVFEVEVHYYDHYLTLLDELILDDEA